MRVALYIGDHKADTFSVRLGWALTRLVQKGTYSKVTHCEAILDENPDGSVTIASASVRDGFCVRTKKNVFLTKENWIIHDKPEWDAEKARAWFIQHDGELYDWRGAGVCWLPVVWSMPNRHFCNESVGAPFIADPETLTPAQFAEVVMS